MFNIVIAIVGIFILYELIKTKNEVIDLNDTVKDLKEELTKKKEKDFDF
ncbi:hypothetical protein [Falsibacillus albus]|nr:hypothetical protein [Falsibacillus albus]